MTQQDVRCAASGLSLLGAESALILLSRAPGVPDWQFAGLPLWGTYVGAGTLHEVSEGANAELILESFVEAVATGEVRIDWKQLGMTPYGFDCIEDMLMLLACARIHAPEAILWGEDILSYALVEANFAATLMSREPAKLGDLMIEQLPETVLVGSACGKRIYSRLVTCSLKRKCQFGLSFLGLAAFAEDLENQRIQPAGPFFSPQPGQREGWLAEALVTFADDQDVVEALEEYAAHEHEGEELENFEAES